MGRCHFLWLLPAAWEPWDRRQTVLLALLILVNVAVYTSRPILAVLLVAVWYLQWQQVVQGRAKVSIALAPGSRIESAPVSSRQRG